MRHLIRGILLLVLVSSRAPATAAEALPIQKSLIRVTTTEQDANYRVPWEPGAISGGVGAGFVISGSRIMTNAHVVSNARFLSVEKEDDPKKYIASVEFIAHDCDLAVLKVSDPDFFKGTVPLTFGDLPPIESSVSVFGYPIGGERLSVTHGIVSRIDFSTYTHSGVDTHLTIQIDAAINPGNSGGPVIQAGKVIGVAFQGYSGDVAQGVGYMIPTPVIKRFLKDIEDGHYDKYMDLSVNWFNVQNPAQRQALGLPDDGTGVLVSSVSSAGSSYGVLKQNDVLLSIDGHTIFSDGFVDLDGSRIQMSEIVERKFKGDEVKLTIFRDKQKMDVVVKLNEAWPFSVQANAYDVKPRYVVFGGLLFQPLSRNFLEANQVEDLRVRFFYDFFTSDEIFKAHPDVIVLGAILPDAINTYLTAFKDGIVDEVNGVKMRTLNDLAAAFAKPADYYVIKLIGEGRPIVLERKAVDAAHDRINSRYNVLKDQNLNENGS